MRRDEAPARPADPQEDEWVEARLVASLMRGARATQLMRLAVIPILVGLLARDANPLVLAAWIAAAVGTALLRAWVMRRFVNELSGAPPGDQLAFFRRWGFSFLAVAPVWGVTMALFFDHVPLPKQAVGWMMVAGMAMFSTITLAPRLRTMRAFIDILLGSACLHLGWHIVVVDDIQDPSQYWLALLLVLFWAVLREAGWRMHLTLRRSYEWQYRNGQLIDSLRREKQAALEAIEIKNRFLASAAHDIRQPVHALGLYADWLSNEPELVHEIAPRIVESTKAVNALFDSLFDLARLDSGKIRLQVGPISLPRLLHDLELQYRPMAEARGLQFRVRSLPDAVAVSDPILLQRIAGNLVANAVKYTVEGGVLLALRRRQGRIVLEVWDTGVGIDPAHEREVFREFFKVPAHAGTEEGFGLGLYIVGRLSSILGHPVSLRTRPGRGTVFRLDLVPCDAEAAARRAAASVNQLDSIPWVRA